MTLRMKIEVVTYYIFKVLGYIAGIVGCLGVLGTVGGLEAGTLTTGQYWLYLFCFVCLIGFAFLLGGLSEVIIEDYHTCLRKMKHQAKRNKTINY